MSISNKQSGFSMLEILVALAIFMSGFIGVAQFTGAALKNIADDNSRGTSLNTMTQLLAPLYVAASGTPTEFKTSLDLFSTDNGVEVSANSGRENYTVKILEAEDDTGLSILGNTSPDTWASPITVGVTITYAGATGLITSKAPYTFQLSN